MDKRALIKLIDQLGGHKVLVYGDFVLDEFLYGQIDRISREAPVFIIAHQQSDFRPGCAANAVANLAALGAQVLPCGVLGADEAADRLVSSLTDLGVTTDCLLKVPAINTALKTRIIAGGRHSKKQQIARVDRLNGAFCTPDADRLVRSRIEELLGGCDAVLISDYGIGGLTPETGAWLVSRAKELDKPVLADSRYRLLNYKGATAMTPNEPEVEECLGVSILSKEDLWKAGKALLDKLRSEALVITRGAEGMTLFIPGSDPLNIPAFGDEEVVDVTGAGDTVIATFTLAITASGDFGLSAGLANIAGGLTVLKKGTSTVSTEEMRTALQRT